MTDEAAVQEIRAAVEAPDLPRAVELARKALADGREHPLFLNLRAFWFEQQGRPLDALTDLERAHALAPDDAIVGNALGLCLANLNRFWDARAAFRNAAARQPDLAPAQFNLGWASEELGLLVEAREAFLRAEQIDPHSALPPARLANLAACSADFERARQHAGRALGLDSNQPLAHLALAACEFADGRTQAAETRLRRILADSRIGRFEHALAFRLLGNCLDASGSTDQAFAAYSASNRETANLYASRFGGSSAEPVSNHLSRFATWFQNTNPAQWKRKNERVPETRPVAAHFFIVGFPCSGTALLEDVLDVHPLVCSTGERDGLETGVRTFLGGADGLGRLSESDTGDLLVFREQYWRKLRELGLAFEGKVLVDSQPYHAVKLPLIVKLFPDARIIFVNRDPRDVVFGCFRSRLRMNPFNHELLTLEGAARLYSSVMRLVDRFRDVLPLTLLDIPYERLVRDPRNCVAAVYRYTGLNPAEADRDPAERIGPRAPATPIGGAGLGEIGAWRPYADRMSPVLPILQPWIERFGTSPD
ncbi:MAG TPA: sulfotransferase [Rhizomicrobium sp.]|jgi:tetratricopeptide (TPR) repeat protein